MVAFREVNSKLWEQGSASFPEEIILMIEGLLKHESVNVGQKEYGRRSNIIDDDHPYDCYCWDDQYKPEADNGVVRTISAGLVHMVKRTVQFR